MPRECLAIIESKSKVHYSRNKAVVAKVSTNTYSFGISPDVAELKDMVKALLLDKKSQNQAHATVKAVEESCVTCGGAHSYRNCPATDGNVYRDNIQEFVSQASRVNYNQGNTNYPPPMMSNQIRPPGFPPVLNDQNFQLNQRNNQNRFNQNQNRGNNFNHGPVYQPSVFQPPAYVKANDAVMRNMQTQGQNMQNQLTNLTDLLTKFVNSNSASTLSSGTLPSNTIANPKSDLKAITTRSELADHSISRSVRVAEDVYVKVGTFHFSTDFVVVNFDVDPRVPLILGRSFLKTGRALIDVFEGELNLREVLGFSDVIASGNPTPYCDPIISTTSLTLTLFENSDFLLEEVDAFLALEDDPTSPEVDQSYLDSRGTYFYYKHFSMMIHHYPLQIKEIICLKEISEKSVLLFSRQFSGYFRIPIDPKDQEKTRFTCPYETFAYRRTPFGLCNAPGTFQRCMMAIFHDMIEKTIEVD
nr:reverse transcriptase domain-containing protein [Tanacetum cinerariifolium]